jgi:hypothetical protein
MPPAQSVVLWQFVQYLSSTPQCFGGGVLATVPAGGDAFAPAGFAAAEPDTAHANVAQPVAATFHSIRMAAKAPSLR